MALGGCGDSLEEKYDVGGSDYGGPEWSDTTEGWYEEETSAESSGSTSDTDGSSSTDSDTGSDTDGASTESTETSTEGTETGGGGSCGWDPVRSGYACGFEGSDPGGTPYACPEGLAEGDSCAASGLTAAGCCDGEGKLWTCMQEFQLVTLKPCVEA